VQAGRPGQVPYPDAQHDRGSHLATSYLEEVKARLKPAGLRSRWNVATGSAAPLIAYRAATGRIGLTVMASHNTPRVVRGIQSNVTANLWRLSAGPLFLVNRAHIKVNGSPPLTPETIFVPFNESETARAALPIATTLAMALESRLVLLLNAPANEERNADNTVEKVLPQNIAAREVAEELTESGCHTEIEHISGGVIGVARRQLQERGSWVIAGSHMRSGLVRILKGSEGDNFLRKCRGPLIVVPKPSISTSREKRLRKYMASSDGIASVY
jgi:nucleotide-binding universal stress UspA family protein